MSAKSQQCSLGCRLAVAELQAGTHCRDAGCFVAAVEARAEAIRAERAANPLTRLKAQLDASFEAQRAEYAHRFVCCVCGRLWGSEHRPGCEGSTAVPGSLFLTDPAGLSAAVRRWRL